MIYKMADRRYFSFNLTKISLRLKKWIVLNKKNKNK